MQPSAADALSAYNSFQAPDATATLTASQNKYGVNQLQDNVKNYRTLTGNLTGAIAAVDPSVTGRTSGSLVTEGQRGALVNRERAPVVAQLGTANTALSQATGDYNTAENSAENDTKNVITSANAKKAQLLQTYQIANEREQAAAAAAAQEAARQEQIREFNTTQNNENARAAASTAARSSASSAAAGPTAQQRAGGGFNFQGSAGKAISARTYSAQAGVSFNSLVKQMADAGDAGAKDVLKNGTKSKYWTAFTWG